MQIDNGCYQRYKWFYNDRRWFFKWELREYRFWEDVVPEGQSCEVYHRRGYVLIKKFRNFEDAYSFKRTLDQSTGYFVNKPTWFDDNRRFPLDDHYYQ